MGSGSWTPASRPPQRRDHPRCGELTETSAAGPIRTMRRLSASALASLSAFTINASHKRGGRDATSRPIGGPDAYSNCCRASYCHAVSVVCSTGHLRLTPLGREGRPPQVSHPRPSRPSRGTATRPKLKDAAQWLTDGHVGEERDVGEEGVAPDARARRRPSMTIRDNRWHNAASVRPARIQRHPLKRSPRRG